MHALYLILVMAAGTAFLRFLPFVIFRDPARRPAVITYLGQALPPAAIGMLCVYCLRNVELTGRDHGIPEIAACLLVAFLQAKWHNVVLSILFGTAFYMAVVQLLV
ncbi:MAG: AzlD domain-containing protein [Clostridia bacterium]|nr:AzlD domain-containing protein [Clostridia bacterium]